MYICTDPEQYKGKIVGTGQCVDFVKVAARAPQTVLWKKGTDVKGRTIPKGAAIATFVNGRYESHKTGNHAAIYIRQDSNAIYVWDQWRNSETTVQPVHERPIRFGGHGPSNDGNGFSVIE
jgi:hypothetical protein